MGREVLLAVAAVALAGCVDPATEAQQTALPGTPIGSFSVSAVQGANSCGSGALGAPASYDFDVSLSESDGSIMYWSTSGASIVSGSLAADGVTFDFKTSAITDMRATGATTTSSSSSSSTGVVALPACSVERDDTGDGVMVGDSTGVTSFSGTLTFAFTPTVGSSCFDLVQSTAPTFAALPCSISYQMNGSRQ